jgi:hypothetical protein
MTELETYLIERLQLICRLGEQFAGTQEGMTGMYMAAKNTLLEIPNLRKQNEGDL